MFIRKLDRLGDIGCRLGGDRVFGDEPLVAGGGDGGVWEALATAYFPQDGRVGTGLGGAPEGGSPVLLNCCALLSVVVWGVTWSRRGIRAQQSARDGCVEGRPSFGRRPARVMGAAAGAMTGAQCAEEQDE